MLQRRQREKKAHALRKLIFDCADTSGEVTVLSLTQGGRNDQPFWMAERFAQELDELTKL